MVNQLPLTDLEIFLKFVIIVLTDVKYFQKNSKNYYTTQIMDNGHCYICNGKFEEYLQVDHRVPYEISGDDENFQQNITDYMLLCASCNRAKSWSCEHCENWIDSKDIEICLKCYWGRPENYDHVTLEKIRRLELTWQGVEVNFFEALEKETDKGNIALPEYIKLLLMDYIGKRDKNGA